MPDQIQQRSPMSSNERPRAPPRYPSYSKRHASFNSPREVPLPSPNIPKSEGPNPFFTSAPHQSPSSSKAQDVFEASPPQSPRVQESERQAAASSSQPRSPSSPTHRTHFHEEMTSRRHKRNNPSLGSSAPLGHSAPSNEPSHRPAADKAKQNLAAPIYPARPFSLPEAQSTSYCSTLNSYLRHSPPNDGPSAAMKSTTWIDRCSSASLPLPSQIPFYSLPRVNPIPNNPPLPSIMASSMSESERDSTRVSSSSPKQVKFPSSQSERPWPRCPSLDGSGSSSGSSNSSLATTDSPTSSSPDTEHSLPASKKASSPPPSKLSEEMLPRTNLSRPPARPISPFRAPMPPPQQPPTTTFSPPTAMGRFMTPSVQAISSYPAPEPPVILPAETTQGYNRSHAPYVPFLSSAPPPPDSWIEVETLHSEYKLHVHLPGFSREGITLSTKRRRILHVVADSWENGGGHFERRISFGYDADLVQVRAEFDGEMLRITIPRRISPVTWSSPIRPAAFGRA